MDGKSEEEDKKRQSCASQLKGMHLSVVLFDLVQSQDDRVTFKSDRSFGFE